MNSFSSQERENNQAERELPIFDPPQYFISYNEDQTLRWYPPVNSRELGIALSYYFPEVKGGMRDKMQAAIAKFLQDERQNNLTLKDPKISDTPEHMASDRLPNMHMETEDQVTRPTVKVPESPSRVKSESHVSHRTSMPEPRALQFVQWDADAKDPSPRIKKRRYDKEERAKVAANRGFACDQHRKQKMKCAPETCPGNKQRFNSSDNMAAKAKAQPPIDKRHSFYLPASENMGAKVKDQPALTKRHSSYLPESGTELQMFAVADTGTFDTSSMPASDPSPGWVTRPSMDPTTLYMLEGLQTSSQSMNLPTPSLEYSSRSHDSVGSMFSTNSNMSFIANYETMDFDISNYEAQPYWPPNEPSDAVGNSFNTFMTMDQPNQMDHAIQMGQPFQVEDKQHSSFNQPSMEGSHHELACNSGMIPPSQNYTINPACTIPLQPFSSLMENTTGITNAQQDLMNWQIARSSSLGQGYDSNTQEMKPMTDGERKTLEKWWGKDRFLEQPDPDRASHHSNGTQPPNEDMVRIETHSSVGNGRRASLREKVKTATGHASPFSKNLFMYKSPEKNKKP